MLKPVLSGIELRSYVHISMMMYSGFMVALRPATAYVATYPLYT